MLIKNQAPQRRSRSLIIFYFLVSYIFAAFLWWTYFHISNIKEQYNLKLEKVAIQFKMYQFDPKSVDADSFTKDNATAEYNRKLNMIIGEALVFFIILFFGSYQIHAGLRRDEQISRQQRNFLLSITHELKSPIAGIKLSLQTLFNRHLDRNPQLRLLGNSIKDTERLQNLVENILLAAKLETNQNNMFVQDEVDLSNLVDDTVQKFTTNFGLNDRIVTHVTPHIYIQGDSIALVSMITNLLENAVKYSLPQQPISITLQHKPAAQSAEIIVADQGVGIPDAEKSKVFHKFYRIGNEDTRKSKGTGLGLFIIKQLVDLHGGSIFVSDNQPQGTVFTIELPCEHSPEIDMNQHLSEHMPSRASSEL